MATVFDQVYKQAKKDLYAQQATLTRERLSRIPTSDLIADYSAQKQTSTCTMKRKTFTKSRDCFFRTCALAQSKM